MSKFYEEISKLKDVLRRGWILRGLGENRVESDAEHTYSMCLLAMEIMSKRNLKLDQLKVYKLILCHELGEIDVGDITPVDGVSKAEKMVKESKCIERISKVANMPEIIELAREYEERQTEESKFVKIIDKLDCVLQAKLYAYKYDRQDIYQEFYSNAYDLIKDYIEFIE
ncbi:MAG: HD domain-containing protein [Clostridia bacterium]|nr:HD domain-containing protein [Clostridia bacterium]